MKIFSNCIPTARYDELITNLPQYKDLPITIFSDRFAQSQEELNINPINIVVLNEPDEFFGLHTTALQLCSQYTLILSWNEKVLNTVPNSYLMLPGEGTLKSDYINLFENTNDRVFEVTFLRGILNMIEGHKMRHKIFDIEPKLTTPHVWWPVLEDFNHSVNNRPGDDNGVQLWAEGKKKYIWNRKSMFHVAVENSSHKNYHTEKIIDCFATKTIPIYWGCKNIEEYWDERGIIRFNNEHELVDIINNLTPDDYYNRLPYINNNYNLAKENGNYFNRLKNLLDQIINLNNIK